MFDDKWQRWRHVQAKIDQATRALAGLRSAADTNDFMDQLTLFLVATRSVSMMLSYQYGLDIAHTMKVKRKDVHLHLPHDEASARQQFENWYANQHQAMFRNHPLFDERDYDTHRLFLPALRYGTSERSHLLVEPGTSIEPPRALWRVGNRVTMGLPISDPQPEDYYFDFEPNKTAVEVCQDYLDLVLRFTVEAREQVAKLWI